MNPATIPRHRSSIARLLLFLAANVATGAAAADDWKREPGEALPIELRLDQEQVGVDVALGSVIQSWVDPSLPDVIDVPVMVPAGTSPGAVLGAGLVVNLAVSAIDQVNLASARRRVAPLGALVADYPLRERFEREFREQVDLDKLGLRADLKVFQSSIHQDFREHTLAAGEGILAIRPSVQFCGNFNCVKVRVWGLFTDREAKKDGSVRVGHPRKGSFVEWNQALPRVHTQGGRRGDPMDADAAAAAMVALGREELFAAIDHGIHEAMKRFAADISAEGRAERAKSTHFDNYEVLGMQLRGQLLENLPRGGSAIRTPMGVTAYEPILRAE